MIELAWQWVASLFLVVGALFFLLAGIALLRMPDLYGRISASSKAVTAGAGACLIAAGAAFLDPGVASRAAAGLAFFLLTSPVAAHVVARAAVYVGVPFAASTSLPDVAEGERDPLRFSR